MAPPLTAACLLFPKVFATINIRAVTIQNNIDEVYYFEDENSAITAGYRACPQCIK